MRVQMLNQRRRLGFIVMQCKEYYSAIPKFVNSGSILARSKRVLTTSSLLIYNCRHLSIKFWTYNVHYCTKTEKMQVSIILQISDTQTYTRITNLSYNLNILQCDFAALVLCNATLFVIPQWRSLFSWILWILWKPSEFSSLKTQKVKQAFPICQQGKTWENTRLDQALGLKHNSYQSTIHRFHRVSNQIKDQTRPLH